MNPQLYEIQQKRAALLAQIATQREEINRIAHQWKKPLGAIDQGLSAVRWLRSHPLAWLGLAGLFLLRKNGVVGVFMSVWRGWKFYQRAKGLVNKARRA
ncbi:MAG: YqjK-like family protein [Gallionella sp.]|nr:YqjK-like family protein [Gallionella sp.]